MRFKPFRLLVLWILVSSSTWATAETLERPAYIQITRNVDRIISLVVIEQLTITYKKDLSECVAYAPERKKGFSCQLTANEFSVSLSWQDETQILDHLYQLADGYTPDYKNALEAQKNPRALLQVIEYAADVNTPLFSGRFYENDLPSFEEVIGQPDLVNQNTAYNRKYLRADINHLYYFDMLFEPAKPISAE